METETHVDAPQDATPPPSIEAEPQDWSADQEAAWRGKVLPNTIGTQDATPKAEEDVPPVVEEKKQEVAEEKPKNKERLERGWSALAEREQKVFAAERDIKEQFAQLDALASVATTLKQGTPTEKLKALQLLGADISELGNAILQSYGVDAPSKKEATDEDRIAKLLEEKFGGIKSELEELRTWKQEQAKQAKLSTIYGQIASKIEEYPFLKTMASVGNRAAIDDVVAYIEYQIDNGREYDVAAILARAEDSYEKRILPEIQAYTGLEKVRQALGQSGAPKTAPAVTREGRTLAPSLAQDLGPEPEDDILTPDEYIKRGVSFLQRAK